MERVSISISCSSSMKTQLKIIYLGILTTDVHLHALSPSSVSCPCLLLFFNFVVASGDCQKITFCLLVNFDLLILLLGTIKDRSNFKDTRIGVLPPL